MRQIDPTKYLDQESRRQIEAIVVREAIEALEEDTKAIRSIIESTLFVNDDALDSRVKTLEEARKRQIELNGLFALKDTKKLEVRVEPEKKSIFRFWK